MGNDDKHRQKSQLWRQTRGHHPNPRYQPGQHIGPKRHRSATARLARVWAGITRHKPPNRNDRHGGGGQPSQPPRRLRIGQPGQEKAQYVQPDGQQKRDMQRRMPGTKHCAGHEIGQHHIATDRNLPALGKAAAVVGDNQGRDGDPDQHRPDCPAQNACHGCQRLPPRHGTARQHQGLPKLLCDEGDKKRHHQMRHDQHRRQRDRQRGKPAR